MNLNKVTIKSNTPEAVSNDAFHNLYLGAQEGNLQMDLEGTINVKNSYPSERLALAGRIDGKPNTEGGEIS